MGAFIVGLQFLDESSRRMVNAMYITWIFAQMVFLLSLFCTNFSNVQPSASSCPTWKYFVCCKSQWTPGLLDIQFDDWCYQCGNEDFRNGVFDVSDDTHVLH